MTHTEIVKKLVGSILPAGASHIDDDRFDNLKDMCKLVNDLVTEIDKVAQMKDRHEHSIKVMGEYASNFLSNTLGISD